MTGPRPSGGSALSGLDKAAIFLLQLDYEESAKIVKSLSEQEVERVSAAIVRLGEITSEQSRAVIEEFWDLAGCGDGIPRGGPGRARRILATAFGADAGEAVLSRAVKSDGGLTQIQILQRTDSRQLSQFLAAEHPQTAALVLSQVGPEKAVEVLGLLPSASRTSVLARMAQMAEASPEIISDIAVHVEEQLQALGRIETVQVSGMSSVVEILAKMERDTSDEILEQLEAEEPGLATEIRDSMFIFDDLLNIDAAGIKELTSRVDRKLLTVALKGTGDDLQEHIFKSMSKRGAEMMREDMEVLGAMKIKDVEAAQKEIIQMAVSMEREGVLSLSAAGSEQYVA